MPVTPAPKAALRRAALARRNALPSAEIAHRSEQLRAGLFEHFPVPEWRWLHLFLPLPTKNEPDTWPIIHQSWAASQAPRLAAPVVDEAEDGPGAVALHAERPYDAVLMDIQMPGMSGVEATMQLRLHPDPARAQVPVLALTANAFRSDVERYLAAGINDCLTKPYKEDALYHKLVALIQAPAAPLYDLAQVYEMADNEPVFVERVVRSFLTHMPGALAQLEAAAAAEEWPQVAKLVHHIKPNLEQFGVAGIAQPLRLLKKPPAPEGSAASHGQAVQVLGQQLRRVLEMLPKTLPPAQPAS